VPAQQTRQIGPAVKTAMTDPHNKTSTYAYNNDGQLTSQTDRPAFRYALSGVSIAAGPG
jgi:hypothetical protein